jgi:diguanylate cyclase (GGDEF)-like protein
VNESALQRAVARLTELLRDRMELGELASAVAHDACELSSAESCSVMLVDANRQILSCYAAHGLGPEEMREIRFKVGEGIAGTAVAERKSIRVDDVSIDARFAARTQKLHIKSILAVPVVVRGVAIGALSVTHSESGRFGPTEQSMLELWAQAVGMDLEAALLYRLTLTDALTHAFNRRYLDEVAAKRMARPAAVFVDLDHFKLVNDQFGHEAGDAVLVETAARLMRCVRSEDVVVRYGGDEFLVLLTGPSAQQVEAIARRIEDELKSRPVDIGGRTIPVSGSIGVVHDNQTNDFQELLRHVDRAMYAAKQSKH